MSSRVEYYDFLRGVAIIMVVGIHTFASSSLDSIYGFISMLVREVLNCAVPIFLAISGFFCGKKILRDQNAKFAFWKKQIPKIYIPALIWSVPYFVLNIIGNDGVFGIGEQILALFTCSYSIYYFIALIIQYYLLLPVLQKHGSVMMPISVVDEEQIIENQEDEIYVKRGEVLTLAAQNAPCVSNRIKVRLFWLGKKPLKTNKKYHR